MKQYLTAFSMAQSMFCALPFRCRRWDETARSRMLLFLPVVGLEIGAMWVALHLLLGFFRIPPMVRALCMCALPYLATGLIHLDGYLDVVDAICSWRDLEARRSILKDSHVGSFAVVWCIFLLLAGFALFASVPAERSPWPLLLLPVVSRCCSALAVMNLPPMSTSQYSHTTDYPRWISVFLWLLILFSTVLAFALWKAGGLVPVAAAAGYALALRRSYRSLEGMNGDISGFCLTVSELCGVAALALI